MLWEMIAEVEVCMLGKEFVMINFGDGSLRGCKVFAVKETGLRGVKLGGGCSSRGMRSCSTARASRGWEIEVDRIREKAGRRLANVCTAGCEDCGEAGLCDFKHSPPGHEAITSFENPPDKAIRSNVPPGA